MGEGAFCGIIVVVVVGFITIQIILVNCTSHESVKLQYHQTTFLNYKEGRDLKRVSSSKIRVAPEYLAI